MLIAVDGSHDEEEPPGAIDKTLVRKEISMIRGRSWIAISALAAGCVGLIAQGPGGLGFQRGFGFGGGVRGVVTGQPFTAQVTNSSVEKLADGGTIKHSSTCSEARDSQGRTVQIVTTTPQGGSGTPFTRTTVTDPVAHTLTSWGSQSKTAMVMNLPAGPGGRGGNWGGPKGPGGPGGPGPGGKFNAQVTHETLTGKSIAGVYATGEKTTITVPAGTEGNDKPLVSTREVWTAQDLKIVLLETSDGPREGFHKVEVTSLTTGEPDPTLFQVPAGYTVTQQTRHRGQ
jgi:hypothetical protein